MSDSILIPADRYTEPLLRLVDVSPLADCCTVGFEGGARIVRTDRPVITLSDGERRLWAVLRSLVNGELRALLDGADGLTLAALSDFFARACFAGRAAS